MATGAQWDLVQTFAWAKMIASNSRSMSLVEAVKKTFGGEMCEVCKVVNDVKQQTTASTTPGGKADTKIVFMPLPATSVFVAIPEPSVWSLSDQSSVSACRAAPPLPPPRV